MKDAIARLARKHGSWLVALGIEADAVAILFDSPATLEGIVLPDVLKVDEERAVEQATKPQKNTETLE